MRCKKHKTYSGNRQPRCKCRDCWLIYHDAAMWRAHLAIKQVGLASRRILEIDGLTPIKVEV